MLDKLSFTSTHGIYDKFKPHHYPYTEEREEQHTKLDHYQREPNKDIHPLHTIHSTSTDVDPEIEYKLRDHGRNYGGVVGNTTKDSKYTHNFQENNNMIQGQINRSYPNDHIAKDHEYSHADMNANDKMQDIKHGVDMRMFDRREGACFADSMQSYSLDKNPSE
ncbi:hypothetical protein WICPIJ_002974 [Wickerhamomyces pijperi]|uniref:Uncharacterized protein n=1 Tax=Wickerhamomyces pijperi TaxID=599730 RepID=A0A9P8QAH1_WICPI|nr:hypothetical protein WICPIJ_002974 [Wickerhamomyces pijperi]